MAKSTNIARYGFTDDPVYRSELLATYGYFDTVGATDVSVITVGMGWDVLVVGNTFVYGRPVNPGDTIKLVDVRGSNSHVKVLGNTAEGQTGMGPSSSSSSP